MKRRTKLLLIIILLVLFITILQFVTGNGGSSFPVYFIFVIALLVIGGIPEK